MLWKTNLALKKELTPKSNKGIEWFDAFLYTQVTSRCRIQSVVIDSRTRKTTQCNSQLFPSCLTQQSGQ
ncbi:hypothetical protein BG259_03705 [Vibrio harveyi]|nr:hypothetical protein BG259_03705 [Vibrio harveyi]